MRSTDLAREHFMNTSTFAPSADEVDAGLASRPSAALLALARRAGLAVWRPGGVAAFVGVMPAFGIATSGD